MKLTRSWALPDWEICLNWIATRIPKEYQFTREMEQMTRQIGLSAYRVEIRSRNAREPWMLRLGTTQDGYTELSRYLDARLGYLVRLGEVNPDTGLTSSDKAIKLLHLVKNEDQRMLAGILMKGEAGLIQEIHDFAGTQDTPTYTTSKTEAALTPLYFRFHLRDGRRYGVALLQTFGKDGLKGDLERDLRQFFGHEVPALTVKLTQFLDAQVLYTFAAQGQLQDVVLINSGKTQESRQAMEDANVGEDALGGDGDKLEMRLHKRGGWRPRVLRKLIEKVTGNHNPVELIDVPGMGAIDDVLVKIKRGERTQTFSLLDPDDSPIREDITSHVLLGPNGYPTWNSLHAAADDAWTRLRELIGG